MMKKDRRLKNIAIVACQIVHRRPPSCESRTLMDSTLQSFVTYSFTRLPWAHERKALLIARHQLVEMRVQIDNQLRGILKTFGLVIGKCGHGQIGQRAEQLAG